MTSTRTTSSRPLTRATTLLLTIALLLLAVPTTGSAETTKQQLDRAKEHAAELDRRIGSAEEELAGIEAELDRLEVELAEAAEQLEIAEGRFEKASRVAQQAADRSAQAEEELADAEDELAANDDMLQSVARDAYKRGGGAAASPQVTMMELVSSGDAEGLSDRIHYLQRSMDERATALENAASLVVRVDVLAERAREQTAEKERLLGLADEAREQSAAAHARVEGIMAETSVRLTRQDELIADLESDRQLAGSQIEDLEQKLEQERIERERRERRERERRERERREREEAAAAAAAAAAAKNSGGSSSGGGGGGGGSVSSSPAGGGLVTVGGITVSSSIGPQLEKLLNAARADGIVLGGSGYRSPEVTARLRRVNGCPDVYNSPASSCRVPTAKPGTSEHEKGLAVDFTYQGSTICFPRPGSQCSGNAAYDWLKANAGNYGFKNLPSEAWHWSTTGR